MRRQGIRPNVVIYSALVTACEKGKGASKALEPSYAMRLRGV